MKALNVICYQGPIMLEVNADGPTPFTSEKGDGFRDMVERQLPHSIEELRSRSA